MKKVFIISPYFPPVNAADMQRIRMSLPYFKQFGWEAEVVTIDPQYGDMVQDDLLVQSIPSNIKVHQVKAFNKQFTSKLGLGSIALRSLWFYYKKVNALLKSGHYDLIYFSTTQFPVCTLGSYWKKRFGIPYIIDMQDPWHSDYYQHKPKKERPPKYWFSYRLNKYTEAIAMKQVDGLVSVSQQYIDVLKRRYEHIKRIPTSVITFGHSSIDIDIAKANAEQFKPLTDRKYKNVVYVGRGGTDIHQALHMVFEAMQKGLREQPESFKNLHLTFVGTSYAPAGQGKATILPLAFTFGLDNYVTELTDRISYYHTLNTLMQSDALLILGSDAQGYTASKLYPYLSTQKPLLAIFNNQSPAMQVLKVFEAPYRYAFDIPELAVTGAFNFLMQVANGQLPVQHYNIDAINKYSAEHITSQQCALFDAVIENTLI